MIPQPIDQVPLFARLSAEERELVTARLRRRQFKPDEVVFTSGRPSDALFIITSGAVKLEDTSTVRTVTMANLSSGSLLGEVDTLLGRPYSATARAVGKTQLLTLSRIDLEDLINLNPSIGLKFSAALGMRVAFLDQYLVTHRLRNIDLLSALSEDDLRAIAQKLDFRSFERGDVFVEAGEPGDAVFIIEEGNVRLITESPEGDTFEELAEGALFGHTALITGKPYPSNARSVSNVSVWILARSSYQDLIQKYPAIKLALTRSLAEPLGPNDQVDALEKMRDLPLLSDVPTEALSAIVSRLVLRHFPAGEVIYAEFTPGDALYIVDAGEVKLHESATVDSPLLDRVRAGETFGEMALLTGRTRAECARAGADATVWVLYKTDFDDLMVQYPEISVSLSRTIAQRLSTNENDNVEKRLHRVKLFAGLATSEIRAISKKINTRRCRAGENLCYAGQAAQQIFMIEKGEVRLLGVGPNGETIVADMLGPGDCYGEQAIVQNGVFSATAQASDEVQMWTISKSEFAAMMQEFPALAVAVSKTMADRLTKTQRLRVQPKSGGARPAPAQRVQRPAVNPRPARPVVPRAMPPNSGVTPRPMPVPPRVSPQPARMEQPPAPDATRVVPRQSIQSPAPDVTRIVPKQTNQPPAPDVTRIVPRQTVQQPAPDVTRVVPRQSVQAGANVAPVAPPAPRPDASTIVQRRAIMQGAAPTAAPAIQPRALRKENTFFSELGPWISHLSNGAKLRIVVLLFLFTWLTLISLPSAAIATVSTAFDGVQSSSNGASKPGVVQGLRDFPKIAFAVLPPIPAILPPKPAPAAAPAKPTIAPTRKPQNKPAPLPLPTVAAPAAAAPVSALPPIDWDSRLGSNSDPVANPDLQGVRLIPASVARGQKFWRLTSIKWERADDHTIYVKLFDESGKRVDGVKLRLTSVGGLNLPMDLKDAGDMCDCNGSYPMFGDGYHVNVEDANPSDKVEGMCMCGIPNVFSHKAHVTYRLIFKLVTNP